MSEKRNYILFQAYGNDEILAECRFALLQLMRYNKPEDICIVLYTDNATYFTNELCIFTNHIIEQLSPELVTEWRGEINFVHRVKIKVLQHFFSRYQGNLIYCDTDTCCLQSLSAMFGEIEKGTVYMHTNEGLIDQRNNIESKKWKRFLSAPVKIKGLPLGQLHQIFMWNAGVIGINSSQASVLEEVLEITDALYPAFPRHTVEQFAFSYVLQKKYTIRAAEAFLYHYWNLKEYRTILSRFFAENTANTVWQQAAQLDAFMPRPMMDQKEAYKKLPFLKKLFTKKWTIDKYPLPW